MRTFIHKRLNLFSQLFSALAAKGVTCADRRLAAGAFGFLGKRRAAVPAEISRHGI